MANKTKNKTNLTTKYNKIFLQKVAPSVSALLVSLFAESEQETKCENWTTFALCIIDLSISLFKTNRKIELVVFRLF